MSRAPLNSLDESLQSFGANRQIVAAFIARNVEFLLVGGLAVQWYVRSRAADDMDLLVNPTSENSKRVAAAFMDLRQTGMQPDSFARESVQAPLKSQHYADIVTPARGGMSYEEVAKSGTIGPTIGDSLNRSLVHEVGHIRSRN